MLCSNCQYNKLESGDRICPRCGADVSPLRPLADLEAPLTDQDMNSEWNGQTYTQYYREPIVDLPPVRREGRRSARAQDASKASPSAPAAKDPSMRGGHSVPPTKRETEAPIEHAGRVFGAGESPKEPLFVRKPSERPTRASTQRKVSFNRRGPRIGLVLISLALVLLVASGSAWYFLTHSQDGQTLLAVWGWSNAPIDAYWRLGESKMREGYVPEAIDAFEKAQKSDPDNVDGLLALANAYERDQKKNEAIKIYEDLMKRLPEHPDAYMRMYRIYKDEEDHANAIDMLEKGRDNTHLESFSKEIREYSPDAPYPSKLGGRFKTDTSITIKASPGTTIKYTMELNPPIKTDDKAEDLTDPQIYGTVYGGKSLEISEGTTRIRAVAIQQNGVPSKEMDETYTVAYPIPPQPKANVASGTYEHAPSVIIYNDDKTIEEFHYTVDDTPATIDSPRFTGPIKLANGLSYLRAIAVNYRGKISPEMRIEYFVKGVTKKKFNNSDAFDKLVLMKTTYDQFERAYGKPKEYGQIDIGGQDELYRADYDFGYACFIKVEGADKLLLYELMVNTADITGPRGLKVGSTESDVLAAFRDMGGQASEKGERLIYNDKLNSLAYYKLESDGHYAAHYYCPRDKKNEFVELSFYFDHEKVVRIHWLRYVGDQ